MRTLVEARPRTADAIVADLVAHGTLEPQQGEAVLHALEPVLRPSAASTRMPLRQGLRLHAAEIAGYLGAVLLVLSAVAFLAQTWQTYTTTTRTLLLSGLAVLTFAAGVAVSRATRRPSDLDPARRRVAGTLLVGSALTAALAVGVALEQQVEQDPRLMVLAPLTALLVGAVGYTLAPTALGHLAVLAAAVAAIMQVAVEVGDENTVAGGLGVLALGVLWFVLVQARVLVEETLGTAMAGLVALGGAQIVQTGPVPAGWQAWLAYALTVAVAVACLAGYAALQRWPLLVVGVLATAVVVPQVLSVWFADTLGLPGLLFVSGLTLLVASLLGLRLGRRAAEP